MTPAPPSFSGGAFRSMAPGTLQPSASRAELSALLAASEACVRRGDESLSLDLLRIIQCAVAAVVDLTAPRCRIVTDSDGCEQLVLAQGMPTEGWTKQVMMRWEKPYMEALVRALSLSERDDVLEIGFGLGYSAAAIQAAWPRSHTIIECDRTVLDELATPFIQNHHGGEGRAVRVIDGTWQEVLARIPDGHFDAVFFDDFPLASNGHDIPMYGRWIDFLRRVLPKTRVGCRVTGYLCDASALSAVDVLTGFQLVEVSVFPVQPPEHALYARGLSKLYVPIMRRRRASV